ncbi:MAG: hypothetical protein ABIQ04_00925 [Candidatus Saccharimonadales bacterium]
MEQINKLQLTVAEWLKDVPHLPVEVRKWIAQNIWWITIVGVVFGAFGIIGALLAVAVVGSVSTALGGVVVGAALTGTLLIATFVSLALLIITVILESMAIKPLKVLNKKGWDLLFLVTIVSLLFGLVSALIRIDVVGVITSVLSAGVSSYFLFEIIGYFKTVDHKKGARKPIVTITK